MRGKGSKESKALPSLNPKIVISKNEKESGLTKPALENYTSAPSNAPKLNLNSSKEIQNYIPSSSIAEGWLMKKGGSRNGLKNWKKRWFQLSDNYLSYYKVGHASRKSNLELNKDMNARGSEFSLAKDRSKQLLGVIPLKGARIIDVVDKQTPSSKSEKLNFKMRIIPKWKESSFCHQCTMEFGKNLKRHHCRNCGESFCSLCSPDALPIPDLGFYRAERVCHPCFNVLTSNQRLTEVDDSLIGQALEFRSQLTKFQEVEDDFSSSKGSVSSPKQLRKRFDSESLPKLVVQKDIANIENQRKSYGIVSLLTTSPKKYMFVIQTKDRDLWVAAESKSEKLHWISHIERAILRHFMEFDISSVIAHSEKLKNIIDNPPKSRENLNLLPSERENIIEKHKASQPISHTNEWEISPKDLIFDKKIGAGIFGEVFAGKLWGTDVAIKKLKISDNMDQSVILKDLKNEVEILSRLRHPNVVLYMGASTKPPNVSIVTEWCSRGSLFDLLQDTSQVINASLIFGIAIGIAQGMNYLHSLEHQIIHRDLKSQNILLDGNFNPKVCDFGLSYGQKIEERSGKFGVFGTPEWMAPEIISGSAYNNKVDVYSYGVLLCELLTRIKPYSDRFQVNGYEDILDIVLDCRLIPTIPDWPGEQMKSLIKLCLSHNPDERPSFASIIKELKSISSSQGLSKTSWSTLSKKSKGSKAKSIFEENKDLKLFLLYDIPRMREMLYSESSSSQLMACRELVDLLSKSSEKFHCTYCGSAPFSSAKFLLVDKETVLVFVVRLINLLNGNDELLIESALKALWQILKVSDREALSEYRGILQEDGTLRKILVLLNSTNIQIKDSASKILCLLTNDLGPIDQVKFVDLSFAGLNAISSLSGGIRGLERLNNILEEDVFLLEEKMRDLQNTISRKKQLMKNFEASTSIMETRWRKKNRVLANAPNLKTGRESIYRPRFTKDSAPHFLSSYAAPTLPDPPSNGKCARDKALPVNIQLDENTLKHKEAVYTIEESETFNAIDLNKFLGDSVILSEIQSIHQIPESFIEYFGDHSRIYHSNALRWNEKVEEWEAAYLFLSGDELRVYFTSDDLPEDPLFVIHIDNDNSQFQVVLGSVFSKPFCLKMNSEGDVFNFCFRSSALAYEWASQINPIEFPERSPNSNISLKENAHANSISKSKNVTSLLSHLIAFGDSNECLKVLKESSSMERLKNLPNAFMEYFEGIPISAFGYLLIYEEISNTVDPSLHGNWLTKFCLLANGELRIYDSKENDPEDSESIIYVSGPFVESFQATVNSSGADEWSKRAIALSDDGRVYLICTRSNEEFTLWSSALSAKC